jgi:hypothetical protein
MDGWILSKATHLRIRDFFSPYTARQIMSKIFSVFGVRHRQSGRLRHPERARHSPSKQAIQDQRGHPRSLQNGECNPGCRSRAGTIEASLLLASINLHSWRTRRGRGPAAFQLLYLLEHHSSAPTQHDDHGEVPGRRVWIPHGSGPHIS